MQCEYAMSKEDILSTQLFTFQKLPIHWINNISDRKRVNLTQGKFVWKLTAYNKSCNASSTTTTYTYEAANDVILTTQSGHHRV